MSYRRSSKKRKCARDAEGKVRQLLRELDADMPAEVRRPRVPRASSSESERVPTIKQISDSIFEVRMIEGCSCPVCFTDLSPGNSGKRMMMRCGHDACGECVVKSLISCKGRCPVCRELVV